MKSRIREVEGPLKKEKSSKKEGYLKLSPRKMRGKNKTMNKKPQ